MAGASALDLVVSENMFQESMARSEALRDADEFGNSSPRVKV